MKNDLEKTINKSEKLDDIENKVDKLENKLQTKNAEVENLQKQLEEVKVQFAGIESRGEGLMLNNQNHKSEEENRCKAEVKKELDKVLSTAVEQGLRDLPFEMVCAHKYSWTAEHSVINYDRISVEFNNANRP